MTLFLRTLLLFLFALFWGGLTFYTGFVVRIMHDVLHDPMDGGLITQRVTNLLQILGAMVAVAMLCNAIVTWRTCRRRSSVLIFLGIVFAGSVLGLFIVHQQLDAAISVDAAEVIDRDQFVIGHRRYNQLTTIEWMASLLYLPVAISAWRSRDQTLNRTSGSASGQS